MSVPRGTTPTVICEFDAGTVDLTEAKNVYVTFSSNLKTITKCGESLLVEPDRVSVYLTQKDTLGFQLDEVEVEVNWTYDGGKRAKSTIESLAVDRTLLMREVE